MWPLKVSCGVRHPDVGTESFRSCGMQGRAGSCTWIFDQDGYLLCFSFLNSAKSRVGGCCRSIMQLPLWGLFGLDSQKYLKCSNFIYFTFQWFLYCGSSCAVFRSPFQLRLMTLQKMMLSVPKWLCISHILIIKDWVRFMLEEGVGRGWQIHTCTHPSRETFVWSEGDLMQWVTQ